MSETEGKKERGVATCENCGQPIPVNVWPDGTVHPIGGKNRCCAEPSYQVVENETPAKFVDEN
ncbi:hypothetical protein [Halalkalicoccus salilacus]|uniref:hypothetical protein n=1 Tax=Halalkalicoccus salilacus TaxID=3117459 RepID=UPI00300F0BE2